MGQKLGSLSPFNAGEGQATIKRPELVRQIIDTLRIRDYLVVGAPGSGKTSLIKEFAEGCTSCLVVRFSWGDSGGDYTPFRTASTGESTLSRFIFILAQKFHDAANQQEQFAQLASSLDSYERILRKRKEPSTLEHIGEIGKRLRDYTPQDITPVIALDDFDRLAVDLGTEALSALLEGLLVFKGESSRRVRLLFTSAIWPDDQWCLFKGKGGLSKEPAEDDLERQLRHLSADFKNDPLPLLTEDQTRELGNLGLQTLWNSEYASQRRDGISSLLNAHKQNIQKWSGGHPLLVKKLYHHFLEQCNEESLEIDDWNKIVRAAREDADVKRLLTRIRQTLLQEQREVLSLTPGILTGNLPHDLRRAADAESLPLLTLPMEFKIGRLQIKTNEVLESLARGGLFVSPTTLTEREQRAPLLIWVGNQAYRRNALLLWEVFAEDVKALRHKYSIGERFASWLVNHYPNWPWVQVLYFSFLIYFILWWLFGIFGVQQLISLLFLVPLLFYLLWVIVYTWLRHRRK